MLPLRNVALRSSLLPRQRCQGRCPEETQGVRYQCPARISTDAQRICWCWHIGGGLRSACRANGSPALRGATCS
eukprot:434739-Pyramimonas_sp.AAC.1